MPDAQTRSTSEPESGAQWTENVTQTPDLLFDCPACRTRLPTRALTYDEFGYPVCPMCTTVDRP